MTAIVNFSARAILGLLAAGSLMIAAPVKSEEMNGTADAVERWSVLITYGEDDCPESTEGEIVVCAHQPEAERYRIPKAVRGKDKEDEAQYAMSWSAQFQNHEDDARLGRPNSCSAAGTSGFAGCQAAFLRDWFAQRK
ncbi:hypothetical protein [Parasphingorhabdus sp.]|uniref:hypothetical protein n=1 Tax=Parasphingorhabdus sp. TaxID=2709688 RepID=UPI0030A8AC7A|nr:hypothetical protein [Sphingomonadales bacterium]